MIARSGMPPNKFKRAYSSSKLPATGVVALPATISANALSTDVWGAEGVVAPDPDPDVAVVGSLVVAVGALSSRSLFWDRISFTLSCAAFVAAASFASFSARSSAVVLTSTVLLGAGVVETVFVPAGVLIVVVDGFGGETSRVV